MTLTLCAPYGLPAGEYQARARAPLRSRSRASAVSLTSISPVSSALYLRPEPAWND